MTRNRKYQITAGSIVLLALLVGGSLYLLAHANDYRHTRFTMMAEGMTRTEVYALIGSPDPSLTMTLPDGTISETWFLSDGYVHHVCDKNGVSTLYHYTDESFAAWLAQFARQLGF